MANSEKSRRYASTRHPTIAAAIAGTFRFTEEKMAKQQLQILRSHFVLSRQQAEGADDGLILWIKGYALTDEETKAGYTGNYAAIGMAKRPDGKITLETIKLESDLKYHPQRERPKHSHPNWGHPILRSVKKQRVYETVEEAESELQLLHEEFPEITIPLVGKLYLIIYSRQQTPPAQKFVLEIKVNEKGGFYIHALANDYKAKQLQDKSAKPPKSAEKREEPPSGYFASMVELKRKKRKKPQWKPGMTGLPEEDAAEPADNP